MNQANALVPVSKEMAVIRDTKEILHEARNAAKDLKEVISQKEKPVKFNGEQYLEYEDWQLAGQFYGYTVKTGEAIPFDIDGIKGAKAHAELLDKEGRIVGGAEAFCMRDEPNWARKPWFQLASMAQTRAGCKALANRLRWFVVLAGFKPTPAEEVESHFESNIQKAVVVEAEPAITLEMARLITDIKEKLASLNHGDEDAMEVHLKMITSYKDSKTKDERWVKISDLPGIAKHKPDWIKGIHKKVSEVFISESEGNNAGKPKST